MSKTVIQFEFNSPAEANSFLQRLTGGGGAAPVAAAPVAAPVAMTAPAPVATPQPQPNPFGFGATMPQTQVAPPVATTPVVAPVSLMPQIIEKAQQLVNAGKSNEVGAVLTNEFGLSRLNDCPPAIQQNLLNRLNQMG